MQPKCFTRTFHGYAHIVEWYDDWRTRLMHGHLRSRHGRIFKNHAGNAIGQFFDEIDMIASIMATIPLAMAP